MTINNNANKKNNNDNKINRILSLLDQGDSLSRFSNRTGTSVDDGARRSNNWRDQWQSSNWAPEVALSPFRALSRRHLTFSFCC